MNQDAVDIKEQGDEEKAEYYAFIKESVKDGTYFQDAQNWYLVRYVRPICERAGLIIGAIVSFMVLLSLTDIIEATFPLVEEFPVIIAAKDQSLYFPNLIAIKSELDEKSKDITVDEAVAKYLVSIYIKDREGYDYSDGEISAISKKFNRLRNTSSSDEYKKFLAIMSRKNSSSPIHHFGKNISRRIVFDSVTFPKRQDKDFASKAKNFLKVELPTKAEVRFRAITTRINKDDVAEETAEELFAKIDFAFSGAHKNTENKKHKLNFVVTNYELFQVDQ